MQPIVDKTSNNFKEAYSIVILAKAVRSTAIEDCPLLFVGYILATVGERVSS
jgi:hypothetical protein